MPHVRDPVREVPRLPGSDRPVPRSGVVLRSVLPPPDRVDLCASEREMIRETERRRRWRQENPGGSNRWRRKIRETDPERMREIHKRAWAKATETPEKRDRTRARQKRWREANPEACKALQAKAYVAAKARYATDPEYRARCAAANIRCRKKREARKRAEKAALLAASQTP